MQVAQQQDFISHAVIGGGDAIEFGISSSAEFFNILSSTLYKDQILAVVREVLCNSWDAHIEAGCTNKPVIITLTESQFTIKDSGKGIHKDDMGAIYGTYGNSTKKNDGKQTGGFGLGCKAPFAYTDHFEVQSSHDGIRTIYNLSKSSAAAQGKPGIVPIASFPTPDSGLQVSIRILNLADYRRFKSLITRIARNGDMNMVLNGEAIGKLGFDTQKANYLITPSGNTLDNETKIMVRYGNVVYPIDSTGDIADQYVQISGHLEKLSNSRHNYSIIFQAPPHSIAVTPSRESLSMQDHTVNTLKGLFEGFLTMISKGFVQECKAMAKDSVTKAVTEKRIADLLTSKEALPTRADVTNVTQIDNLTTMASAYLSRHYPSGIEFRKSDIQFRLDSMVKAGMLNRGLVQTFLREMEDVQTTYTHRNYWGTTQEDTDWLQKRVIGPLVSKMLKAGIDHSRLYTYDSHDCNASRGYSGSADKPIISAVNAKPSHLFNTIPFLRNIVVLAKAKRDLTDRAYRTEVFKEQGKFDGFLFYHVSMKKDDHVNALKFFTDLGMTVVDIVNRQEWEIDYAATPAVAVPRKPPKTGVVALKSILTTRGRIDTSLSKEGNAMRITAPEAVINLSVRQGLSTNCFARWMESDVQTITKLFGDKIGITHNSAAYAKLVEKGVLPFEDYLNTKLSEAMMTSPGIQEFWAYHPRRTMERHFGSHGILGMIYNHKVLRDHFSLVNNLTDEEKLYVELWDRVEQVYYRTLPTPLLKAKEHLKGIPLHAANNTVLTKLKNHPIIGMIDESGLSAILRKHDVASPEVTKALSVFLSVIN